MRLFTGIHLPREVAGSLAQLIGKLRPHARIHWSPPENLHITTKFIGEWPEPRVGEVEAALGRLARHAPMTIRLRGLGYFPNPHSPRVFWVGMEAPPELAALARETDLAMAALGVAQEKRAFSPHLTLARIKEPAPMQALREAVAALPSQEFGEFTADCFYLYQSRLAPSGSVYTKLSEYRLAK
jgi:RNA 2',3'-cyclic 3'-phosphodiesterase